MITKFLISISVIILLMALAVTWMTNLQGSEQTETPPALTLEEEKIQENQQE
jgi:hypothetical protein